MAYVRQRGNQVLIVHGVRDPDTRAVEQRVLFTFYTRAEALDALGRGAPGGAATFHHRMERRYPNHRFDWKAIDAALARLLKALPETSEAGGLEPEGLHGALAVFARQVVLALGGDASVLTQEASALPAQLGVLREMLDELLAAPSKATSAAGPSWLSRLLDSRVPPEVEEQWADALDRGDLARAEAAFTLLTLAFADYAEGHNYLGLIALRRGRNDDAADHFRRAMEVGRAQLPRRVARDRWWADLATRPYMRGLRNLALAQVRGGRYDEALASCDQLESECHDRITATGHRASVWLCTKRWAKAMEAGRFLHEIYPEESLTVALAAFELGEVDEARAHLLRAALAAPRAVAAVLGEPMPAPTGYEEATDHDAGVQMVGALRGFIAVRSAASKRFFRTQWRSDLFEGLRAERAAVAARWAQDRTGRDRAAFDRMQAMQTMAFAREVVGLPQERRRRVRA